MTNKRLWLFRTSLFFLSLLLCQMLSYFVVTKSYAIINQEFIFGFYGNNDSGIALSVLVLAVLLVVYKRLRRSLAFFLVFAGALSNIIDRIVYGGVPDYFNFLVISFNLADSMIILGLVSVILENIKTPSKTFMV